MVRCHRELHEMRPWQCSGDIVMANKWFKECKAGSWVMSSHDPWKGYAAWQDSIMLQCIFGVLNWFVNKCMCLCICVYLCNVCWVWFYALPSKINDLNMFACAVPGCWNQRWCSTLCLHGGGSCQGHWLQHSPPSSIADKRSSSRLSWHVLEKLKLNMKTLQLCLFLLPVALQLCMHYL